MAGGSASNSYFSSDFTSPADQAKINSATSSGGGFNQSSVTPGKLGTSLGTGYFDPANNKFSVDPSISKLNPNLSGTNALAPAAQQPKSNASSSGGAGASTKPRSVADIKSILLRPATTSHFICNFQPPSAVDGWEGKKESGNYAGAKYNAINTEYIQLLCCEASLPGSTLATHEITNDFHGVTQKNAYRKLYDDRLDFTFYVDRDYTTIKFFEGWMSYIVSESVSGEHGSPGFMEPNYFYRMNYPKDYKCDTLYITKFEKDTGRPDSGPTLEYQFFEAFPIAINSIPISYESSQLLKVTVSFSFTKFLIKAMRGGNAASKVPTKPNPNAPATPGLQQPKRTTINDDVAELQAMRSASIMRQQGFDATSAPGGKVTFAGRTSQ